MIFPHTFFLCRNFSFLSIQNNPRNQRNFKLEHDGLVCKQRSQNSPWVELNRKKWLFKFFSALAIRSPPGSPFLFRWGDKRRAGEGKGCTVTWHSVNDREGSPSVRLIALFRRKQSLTACLGQVHAYNNVYRNISYLYTRHNQFHIPLLSWWLNPCKSYQQPVSWQKEITQMEALLCVVS